MASPKRRRLDEELVEQGFFADRQTAMRSVLAGDVSLRGERLTQAGLKVDVGAPLHVKMARNASRLGRGVYVGRGGLKLEGALERFGIDPTGWNCVDVGCSTGGFTDCLLKAGASRVAAVDVGYGQFDWGLRGNGRVALFERTNICDALPEDLGAPFDLAVADVSFTSVGHIVESVVGLLGPGGLFCSLVKPQFEARREEVGEGGIVRDPSVHERVLAMAAHTMEEASLTVRGVCPSPIHGAKGNIEYFVLGQMPSDARDAAPPRGSAGEDAGSEACPRRVDEGAIRACVEEAWEGSEVFFAQTPPLDGTDSEGGCPEGGCPKGGYSGEEEPIDDRTDRFGRKDYRK